MAHRIWKESKQQPGTAGPGNMLGSCLVSIHFLWAILSTSTVLVVHHHCVEYYTFLISFIDDNRFVFRSVLEYVTVHSEIQISMFLCILYQYCIILMMGSIMRRPTVQGVKYQLKLILLWTSCALINEVYLMHAWLTRLYWDNLWLEAWLEVRTTGISLASLGKSMRT